MEAIFQLKLPSDIKSLILSYTSSVTADMINEFWEKDVFELRKVNPNKFVYISPTRYFDLWSGWRTPRVNTSVPFYGIGMPSILKVQMDAGFWADEVGEDRINMSRLHWDAVSLNDLNQILNQNGIESVHSEKTAYEKLMKL